MNEQAWANTVIQQCCQRGITHFFVAPGSRCTPLTLAIARHPDAQVTQHFDERGLAFAALGFAKATRLPGVFVCTSGTAVANAFPAVIEASIECIPLFLFTADRPDELRGTGANQTIDQRQIFGAYPKLFFHMPVPEDVDSDQNEVLFQALSKGFEAVSGGPVHFNWMFREPFEIADGEDDLSVAPSSETMPSNPSSPVGYDVQGNAVIAVGDCCCREAAQIVSLSAKLHCPMLTDVTSGLRIASTELPSQFDLPKPDTILHLGGRLVSKSWLKWTKSLEESGTRMVHVSATEQTINPNRLEQIKLVTPLEDLVSKVNGSPTCDSFLRNWRRAAELQSNAIESCLQESTQLSEPLISYHISKMCPPNHGWFIGNSMPIRDMDLFGIGNKTPSETQFVRSVAANRGASGIDGLMATAFGYANGIGKPTTVLLGDLSALHDLNSFGLLAKSAVPMIVVILNNRGGHIFDQLPIRQSEYFEQYFATPHSLEFEGAAKMFGIPYRSIADWAEFKSSYERTTRQPETVVIELLTDRSINSETRALVQREIAECSARL